MARPPPVACGDDHNATRSPADYEYARRLLHETMKPYAVAYFRWDDEAQNMRFRQRYRAEHSYIITRDDIDVGWLAKWKEAGQIVLGELCVEPHAQGQGIGSHILRDLLDEGRAKGLPVSLGVLRNNPARRLYERHGFRIVREEAYKFYMRWDKQAGHEAG